MVLLFGRGVMVSVLIHGLYSNQQIRVQIADEHTERLLEMCKDKVGTAAGLYKAMHPDVYDSTEEHQRIRDEYLRSEQNKPTPDPRDDERNEVIRQAHVFGENVSQSLYKRLYSERQNLLSRLEALNYILEDWTVDTERTIKLQHALRTLGYD